MKEFTIGANDSRQRVDKFVEKVTEKLPRSLLYKAIRKKDIKKNGKRCEAQEKLEEGDVLRIYLPDEFFSEKKQVLNPEIPSISIAYEDENILVAEKPVGLLSHSDEPGEQDTAIARIQQVLIKSGEYDPEKEQSFSPALISRLDRNTAGLIAAAKTAPALRELSQMMRDHQIHKTYVAWVHGEVATSGELTGRIEKNTQDNKMYLGDEGKFAHCKYQRISLEDTPFGVFSLVKIDLITGRSHQIRVQFANDGHPLVGDVKYGGRKTKRSHGQLLYASQLTFSPQQDSPLAYLSTVSIEQIPSWAVLPFHLKFE